MRFFLPIVWLAFCASAIAEIWPGFRGDGTSRTDANPPTTWSDDSNVAWTAELPGYGQSSPVVWGDLVFTTSTEGKSKDSLFVEARDLESGELAWSKKLETSLKIEASKMVSLAAPTPAVDSERVYAFFESGDLIAFDHAGEEIWKRSLTTEFGAFKGMHGLGSSLAQTADALIVLAEHDGEAYLISIDKMTGESLWKIDREARVSWSSPIVSGNRILISSNGVVEARNAADGTEIWKIEGIEGNTVASPSVSEDGERIVIGSSAPRTCQAIDFGSGKSIWTASATSSFGSPLVFDGLVYFVNRAGALQCVDLSDGELLWETRLPGSCWASPMAAGGKIFCFCKDGGKALVLEPNRDEPKIIAENTLSSLGAEGDRIYGFAATENSIVIRSGSRLVCVRGESKAP
ncbi:MAG: outer membrane protein assembly factor BamB [Verrucomicrobiales bacterium]|jgi:outer membrane protein assembly factor BamB